MEDDGYPRGLSPADLEQSLTTLRAMAAEVHAACTLVRSLPGSNDRTCVVVRVHRICRDEVSYTDLRIAGTPSRSDIDQSSVEHCCFLCPCTADGCTYEPVEMVI